MEISGGTCTSGHLVQSNLTEEFSLCCEGSWTKGGLTPTALVLLCLAEGTGCTEAGQVTSGKGLGYKSVMSNRRQKETLLCAVIEAEAYKESQRGDEKCIGMYIGKNV